MFWITNPDNYVKDNHAAGSANYGFWYRAEEHVTGVSAAAGMGTGVCPKGTPLLQFENNVAHSNGRYGLRVYDEYYPRMNPCQPVSSTNPYVEAKFNGLFSYFNNVNGIQISAVAHVRLHNFHVADNKERGFEMPGAQGGLVRGDWGMHNAIDASLVVGLSGNDFTPLKTVLGIEAPAWHRLLVSNVTFANFEHPKTFALGAVAKDGFSPLGGGWETRFAHISWVAASRRVNWEHKHGERVPVTSFLAEISVAVQKRFLWIWMVHLQGGLQMR